MSSTSFLIRTKKPIGPILIAGLGIIPSLWTNCIFTLILQQNSHQNYYTEVYNTKEYFITIVKTVQYEFLVLCLIAIAGLIWGLLKSDKKYLYPWACVKFCEIIIIAIGGFMIMQDAGFILDGIVPLGIGAISINLYACLCVYKGYKRMMIPLPPKHLSITAEDTKQDVKVLLEENSQKENTYINEENMRVIDTNQNIKDIPAIHCTLNK